MFIQNPFNDSYNIENSMYCMPQGNRLWRLDKNTTASDRVMEVHQEFRNFILSENFSCVLGKAAIKKETYRFGFYEDMTSEDAIAGVSRDLYNYILERPDMDHDYTTFIASFATPKIQSEKDFEQNLWDFLERLADKDKKYHRYDPSVSSNPQDSNYAYSFGSQAFFVIGLHPLSSRLSRKFTYPTIVFNPHTQFRNLKNSNKFSKFQTVIRNKEITLQGNINPNLADFGEVSEARQYSGRYVEKEWVCPHMHKVLTKT